MIRILYPLTALMLMAISAACPADPKGYIGKVDEFEPRFNQIIVDDIPFKLATGLRVFDKNGRSVSMLNIREGSIIRYKPEGYPEKANNGGTIYEISILPKRTRIRR